MPAPNSAPRFLLPTNCLGVAQLSAANVNRDGTGTIVDITTAGSQGTEITLIRVCASGTTTAGVVRLFIHNGIGYRLYKELMVTAVTPSTAVEAFSIEFTPTKPLILPTGYKIAASTHNAETFNAFAHGGDY
jgi:hypothetical protein